MVFIVDGASSLVLSFFLTGPTSETVEEDVAHSFLIILRIYFNPQLITSGCVHKILSLS